MALRCHRSVTAATGAAPGGVSRTLSERLAEAYPERHIRAGLPSAPPRWAFDFWPEGVNKEGEFLVECFGFSDLWRTLPGAEIWLDPSITLAHTGPHVFEQNPSRWLDEQEERVVREAAAAI